MKDLLNSDDPLKVYVRHSADTKTDTVKVEASFTISTEVDIPLFGRSLTEYGWDIAGYESMVANALYDRLCHGLLQGYEIQKHEIYLDGKPIVLPQDALGPRKVEFYENKEV